MASRNILKFNSTLYRSLLQSHLYLLNRSDQQLIQRTQAGLLFTAVCLDTIVFYCLFALSPVSKPFRRVEFLLAVHSFSHEHITPFAYELQIQAAPIEPGPHGPPVVMIRSGKLGMLYKQMPR